MKKVFPAILLLSMVLSLLFHGCSGDDGTEPTPAEQYSRNVVIEAFTSHFCTYCPISKKAIDSLFSQHGDSLVVIKYHDRSLGPDTLTPCTTFVNNRRSRYNVSDLPTVVFDGVESHTGASGDMYNTYFNIVKDRFSKNSDLKFSTFSADVVDSSSVSYNLSIVSEKNISGKLFFVLTEDSVIFEDSLYNFVVRQVYPDASGMDFSVSESSPFGTSGSIPLAWQPSGDVWLNIFAQNVGDNLIYQSCSVNLGKVSTSPIYTFNFSVSPETTQTVTAGSTATFYFYLENTGSVQDNYEGVASQVDTVPGWIWIMCSGGICHMPAATVTDTFTIDPYAIDTFYIEVTTNSTPGTEKINVAVSSFGDTSLTKSINIYTEVQ